MAGHVTDSERMKKSSGPVKHTDRFGRELERRRPARELEASAGKEGSQQNVAQSCFAFPFLHKFIFNLSSIVCIA